MFPQRNGLHSLHRTLSVLIFQLLLTHFCRGQSRLIGLTQPIVANVGDDIILPCHLEPGQDLVAATLEWTKPDMNPIFVHVRRAGQNLLIQHPAYKERTSISIKELKRGNMSLKLSDVKPSDQGRYECVIPNLNENSFVDLVVASGAASSPIINLAGIDRTRGGVILQCEAKGWYPEPEVFWLDGEGNLLSAGPPETVRGPDDLYTVSRRLTVRKSDSFTCRVQQKNIKQTRETHFYVPDDFFEVQSSSAVTVCLAVSLAVSILLILLLLFFVRRPNIFKTRRKESKKKEHFEIRLTEDHQELLEEKTGRTEAEEDLKAKIKEPAAIGVFDLEVSQAQGNSSSAGQDSDTGHIVVVEVEGKYVRLKNMSDKNQPMQGWELHTRVNKRKPIIHPLGHLLVLQAKDTVYVDCRQKFWNTGDRLLINLYSDTGELKHREMLEIGNSQIKPLQLDTSSASQDSDTGHIIVDKVDPKGKYVCLKNTSNKSLLKNQNIGLWELHIQVDNRKPIIYTFDFRFKLKPGQTVTIWSRESGITSNFTTDLMSSESWSSGDQLLGTLYRDTGEEVSMKKVYISYV